MDFLPEEYGAKVSLSADIENGVDEEPL